MLIIPVLVIFFLENGLTMAEVLILQSLFSIAIVLFEIPSGYFSDIIGRKLSIIAGCILSFAGFTVYSFSYGFWGFLAGELILGLGASFISGADSALLYDSLAYIKKERSYTKMEGRVTSIGNFSEGLASIAGGFLALISLRTPLICEAVIIFFAIPIAFTLFEPPRNKLNNSEGNFRSILKIVKYSLHDHAEIKWLILYSSLVGASTLTIVWFIQPYLKSAGLPLALFWYCMGYTAIFSWYFFPEFLQV